MADVAYVLVRRPVSLKPGDVVAAARRYGIELTPSVAAREPGDDNALSFDGPGGIGLVIESMPAPHPDVARMPLGVTSPAPEEAAAAQAHLIVAATGLAGTERERDTKLAILAAAAIDSVEMARTGSTGTGSTGTASTGTGSTGSLAVAAWLGHGTVFHRAAFFADAARFAADQHQPLPVEVAVDVTAAPESGNRMSFLTRGLRRYGREEIYVTCPVDGTGALGFVLDLARWLLNDPDAQLRIGGTVGRNEEERILVQRGPDPAGPGPEVIRLDLP